MAKKKKIKNVTRGRGRFLNRSGHHTVASIAYEARLEKSFLPDGPPACYGTVWVNDCSRIITLSLDLDTRDGYENSVHKIQTMIKTLEAALEDMAEVREIFLEHKRNLKKKKKKKTKKK
jgi:hypothetical protein